jgi:sec-independent protein translocase protein TatA
MLPNVGPWEMIVILLVVFMMFGSKRLPEIARGLGKGIREFKREISGITEEINSTADTQPSRPMQVADEEKRKRQDSGDPSGPAIL